MSAAVSDAVAGPGLIWGVKASFCEYVAASPGGRIDVEDGALQDEEHKFFFPLASTMTREKDAIQGLSFHGTVTFSAHDGMLSVALADPFIHIASDMVRLWIRRPGRPVGSPSDYQVIEDSPLAARGRDVEHQALEVLEPLLCVNAVTLFDNVYPYRTLMAPLRIVGL